MFVLSFVFLSVVAFVGVGGVVVVVLVGVCWAIGLVRLACSAVVGSAVVGEMGSRRTRQRQLEARGVDVEIQLGVKTGSWV